MTLKVRGKLVFSMRPIYHLISRLSDFILEVNKISLLLFTSSLCNREAPFLKRLSFSEVRPEVSQEYHVIRLIILFLSEC